MPKGQAFVTWNAQEDTKLFHTILAVHDVKIDYAAVAAAFGECKLLRTWTSLPRLTFGQGPNIPGSCIATRMARLRKKAAAISADGKPFVRARTQAPAMGKMPSTSRKRGRMLKTQSRYVIPRQKSFKTLPTDRSADISGEESLVSAVDTDSEAPTGLRTPERSIKRTKTRASPRSTEKRDYKTLSDPFVTTNAKDEEGNHIFEADKSESEDSGDSDEEYGKGGGIKMEEDAETVV